MLNVGIGEISALSTAFLWAVSFQIHTALSKVFGVSGIVMLRLPISSALLAIAMYASGVEFNWPGNQLMFYMLLSAAIGVALCDSAIFASSTRIGVSLAVLLQSLSASFAALMGYFFLNENISLIGVIGMCIAFSGVGIVLTEGGVNLPLKEGESHSKKMKLGIIFGLISAVSMAAGLLFSKHALAAGVSPLYVGWLRVTVALLIISPPSILLKKKSGQLGIAAAVRNQPKSLLYLMMGGLCGTTGIWLSMMAVQHANIGTASLLIGMSPISVLIVGSFLEKRVPSLRAIGGSLTAVCGTGLVLLN